MRDAAVLRVAVLRLERSDPLRRERRADLHAGRGRVGGQPLPVAPPVAADRVVRVVAVLRVVRRGVAARVVAGVRHRVGDPAEQRQRQQRRGLRGSVLLHLRVRGAEVLAALAVVERVAPAVREVGEVPVLSVVAAADLPVVGLGAVAAPAVDRQVDGPWRSACPRSSRRRSTARSGACPSSGRRPAGEPWRRGRRTRAGVVRHLPARALPGPREGPPPGPPPSVVGHRIL